MKKQMTMMIEKGTIFYMGDFGSNGRMSNQIFQLAYLIGLTEKYSDTQFFIPEWKYKEYFKGDFENNIKSFAKFPKFYKEPFYHYTEIQEEDILNCYFINGSCSIEVIHVSGYFQSPKYWEHCKEKIFEMFQFQDWMHERCGDKILKATNFRSDVPVAVHYRFGDYKGNSYYANLIEDGYYERAVNKVLESTTAGVVFIIFSDEIDLALTEFKKIAETNKRIKFATIDTETDIEAMCCMSLMEGIVTANSSFSWWASQLGNNEKLVIMPKIWFNNAGLANDTKDLYPENALIL